MRKSLKKGLGNGISVIIFAGIIAGFPSAVSRTLTLLQTGEVQLLTIIAVMAVILAVTAAIVFMETSSRRLPIQYVRKGGGGKGNVATSYLPLKLNPAGVIPIIFAMSILAFPSTLATFSENEIVQKISFLLLA